MCGRLSFVTTKEKILEQFGERLELGDGPLPLSYNIAPTQQAFVLLNEHPEALDRLSWGLVPHWAKDVKDAAKRINARSEGIADKPSFRLPIRNQRCVVLADSFYEWQREGKQKRPFRILRADGRLLALAGVWDTWRKPEGGVLRTFSVITTTPNREMAAVHDRMPVLLNTPREIAQWLGEIPLEEAIDLLRPADDGLLRLYRVSEKVNAAYNDGPELHQPAPPPPPDLFG
ncbi:MAG: SOS response-associated peptidase [Saprospiraceae bacterium]|nr:SOS response-associated peptidase [Saprospiraceae bacterium]